MLCLWMQRAFSATGFCGACAAIAKIPGSRSKAASKRSQIHSSCGLSAAACSEPQNPTSGLKGTPGCEKKGQLREPGEKTRVRNKNDGKALWPRVLRCFTSAASTCRAGANTKIPSSETGIAKKTRASTLTFEGRHLFATNAPQSFALELPQVLAAAAGRRGEKVAEPGFDPGTFGYDPTR